MEYVKDMQKRGALGDEEIAFLKEGIVFYTLKLAMFGMRPDDILERKHLIIHAISNGKDNYCKKPPDSS